MKMTADDYIRKHWEPRRVWTHLEWPKHRNRFARIATMLNGPSKSGLYVDVGCCFGHSTYHLARLQTGTWHGVDFSLRAVDMAKTFFPKLNFIFCSGFDDLALLGPYDGVVCSEVIEHVEDDAGLAQALAIITRGKLVVTTPAVRVNDPGHLRVYNEASLAALFKDLGLQVLTSIHGPFIYLQGWMPPAEAGE